MFVFLLSKKFVFYSINSLCIFEKNFSGLLEEPSVYMYVVNEVKEIFANIRGNSR